MASLVNKIVKMQEKAKELEKQEKRLMKELEKVMQKKEEIINKLNALSNILEKNYDKIKETDMNQNSDNNIISFSNNDNS